MKRRGVPPRSASYNCPGQLAELETKACCYCKMADISAFRCREQLSHVSPNWDADEAATCPDVAEACRDAAPQVGPPPDRGTSAAPAPRAPAKAKAAKTASSTGKPRGRPPKGMSWSAELQQWVRPESGEGGEPAAAAAITDECGLLEATEPSASCTRPNARASGGSSAHDGALTMADMRPRRRAARRSVAPTNTRCCTLLENQGM